MKKVFKNIASQLHLWLGVSSGLVVFIVALTGSLLVFEEELEPVINKQLHVVEVPAKAEPLALDQLKSVVSKAYPEKRISRIVIEPAAERTVIFELTEGKKEKDFFTVGVNPYTAAVTDTRNENDAFFHVVLQLHRYLCMEETGKVITGIACVMFLVIQITGLVLWWPNRKNKKQRFTIKWNAKFKRLNWDLHAVFGFYVLPFVFLIAATGLVWSYKWVNNLIYITFDGKPQQKREAPANSTATGRAEYGALARIYSETNRQLPHQGKIQITVPESDSLSITVSKVDETASVSNVVDFLYFDQNNGNLTGKRLYDQETRGMKVRRLVYPIHTGSIWGWPTKILAFIVTLIAASLPVTGIVIWLGRKFKKEKKVKRVTTRPMARKAKAAV